MENKQDKKKNPFGLLKKESRTLAATVGTEALNNDNYKTPPPVEPTAVVSTSGTSVVSKTAIPLTIEPVAAITLSTVDKVPIQEISKEVVGEKPELTKVKKKPGPKKNPEMGETTLTRISVRSNQVLNLLCTIENKTHIEFLDSLLASHPLYSKVKGLL